MPVHFDPVRVKILYISLLCPDAGSYMSLLSVCFCQLDRLGIYVITGPFKSCIRTDLGQGVFPDLFHELGRETAPFFKGEMSVDTGGYVKGFQSGLDQQRSASAHGVDHS